MNLGYTDIKHPPYWAPAYQWKDRMQMPRSARPAIMIDSRLRAIRSESEYRQGAWDYYDAVREFAELFPEMCRSFDGLIQHAFERRHKLQNHSPEALIQVIKNWEGFEILNSPGAVGDLLHNARHIHKFIRKYLWGNVYWSFMCRLLLDASGVDIRELDQRRGGWKLRTLRARRIGLSRAERDVATALHEMMHLSNWELVDERAFNRANMALVYYEFVKPTDQQFKRAMIDRGLDPAKPKEYYRHWRVQLTDAMFRAPSMGTLEQFGWDN